MDSTPPVSVFWLPLANPVGFTETELSSPGLLEVEGAPETLSACVFVLASSAGSITEVVLDKDTTRAELLEGTPSWSGFGEVADPSDGSARDEAGVL